MKRGYLPSQRPSGSLDEIFQAQVVTVQDGDEASWAMSGFLRVDGVECRGRTGEGVEGLDQAKRSESLDDEVVEKQERAVQKQRSAGVRCDRLAWRLGRMVGGILPRGLAYTGAYSRAMGEPEPASSGRRAI
jgi:hypothetical protein